MIDAGKGHTASTAGAVLGLLQADESKDGSE